MLTRLHQFLDQPFTPKMHRIAGILLILLSPFLTWGYFVGLYLSFNFRREQVPGDYRHTFFPPLQIFIIILSVLFTGYLLFFLFKTIKAQFQAAKQDRPIQTLRSEGKQLLKTLLLFSLSSVPAAVYFPTLFTPFGVPFIGKSDSPFYLSVFPPLLYLFHLEQEQQKGKTLSKIHSILHKIAFAFLLLNNLVTLPTALIALMLFLCIVSPTC